MPMSEKDILRGDDGFMRVMLLGPPKSGKTCAALLTSPRPMYVINADPQGVTPAAKLGAKFDYDNVIIYSDLIKSVKMLQKECQRGNGRPKYKTVVIDTVSMLSKYLVSELTAQGAKGFDMWRELQHRLLMPIQDLMMLPVHLILNAHAVGRGGDAGDMGMAPLVDGASKDIIPALCNDWLWLEVTPGKENRPTKREFLTEAEGSWKHGCRSLQGAGRINADFHEFIKRAGLKA